MMKTTSETGHIKNVATFETLNSFVLNYGAVWQPSNAAISLENLQKKAVAARAAVDYLNGLLTAYSSIIADRKMAFDPLSKLSTRVFNALKATAATQANIDQAESLHQKLQGRRASAKLSDAEKQSLQAAGKEINQISASQQSFDNRLDSLDKQIKLLGTIPAYAPNEVELQLKSLSKLYKDLLEKNNAAVGQAALLSNARIARDEMFYHPETGMLALAADAKTYAKSLFGNSAPLYKQISGLIFKQ